MLPFTLGFLSYLCAYASAETTLYIPGANEQPLSVQQIGTDGNGRTSWVIGPGTLTGTFTGPTVQFTATLVEGPFDALLGGSIPGGPAFSYSCAISTSQANCQLVVSDQTMTETTGITEIVTPFVVQGGDGPSSSIPGTGPPSPTPTPKPVDNSSSFPKAPTAATPTSDLPAQPTETLDNSAHFHTKPKHHMSWVWLVLGLMNVFHNIT